MIVFGKNDKVENIGILEKEEAKAYINFLDSEADRHKRNIVEAEQEGDAICMWPAEQRRYNKALELFWRSAIRRHRKDIVEIDALISTLKGFYGI